MKDIFTKTYPWKQQWHVLTTVVCVSPWGPPLQCTGGAVCRQYLKTHPQQLIHHYCQWELLETCDENDQLLILTGFGKNKAYTSFTYISSFVLDNSSTQQLQVTPHKYC